MNVSKQNKITIQSPVSWYYQLKKKYNHKKCPTCGKGPLLFLEKNRHLTIQCLQNASCSKNVSIAVDTCFSYDKMYTTHKDAYMDSVEKILKKKFDIIFNYTSNHDIAALKTTYMDTKTEYETMNQLYYQHADQRQAELKPLYETKDEIFQKLKTVSS